MWFAQKWWGGAFGPSGRRGSDASSRRIGWVTGPSRFRGPMREKEGSQLLPNLYGALAGVVVFACLREWGVDYYTAFGIGLAAFFIVRWVFRRVAS
jgi:hypothetical protein